MEALSVYTDLQGLAKLRGELRKEGQDARLETVAGQFASVFTHMMLKSMRDASLGEGIFDSNQSLFYRDLFDQQLALSLSEASGVGIKTMLVAHLRKTAGMMADGGEQVGEKARGVAAYRRVSDQSLPANSAEPVQDQHPPAVTEGSRSNVRSGSQPG